MGNESIDRCYLLLALPFRPGKPATRPAQFDQIRRDINISSAYYLPLPDLRGGSIDSLIEASDAAARADTQLEGSIDRLLTVLTEVSGMSRKEVAPLALSRDAFSKKENETLSTPEGTLRHFTWSVRMFNPRQSLTSLIDQLTTTVAAGDQQIQLSLASFTELHRKATSTAERHAGPLTQRPIQRLIQSWGETEAPITLLSDSMMSNSVAVTPTEPSEIVFPIDTELFKTLFAVIPKVHFTRWSETDISQYIVPQSTRVVFAEDTTHMLISFIILRNQETTLRQDLRKFATTPNGIDITVREPSAQDADVRLVAVLQAQEAERKSQILTQLYQQCSLTHTVMLHIKMIRLFIESSLKFGFATNMVTLLLVSPSQRREEDLLMRLTTLYSNFAPMHLLEETPEEAAALAAAVGDVHKTDLQVDLPFVALSVPNMEGTK